MSEKTTKKAKTLFKMDESQLRSIFSDSGLLPGSPSDEFDCIIHPLIGLFYQNQSRPAIEEFIKTELNDHFGIEIRKKEQTQLLDELYSWWQRRRGTNV